MKLKLCFMALALAALLSVSACSGVLVDKKYSGGRESRLKIDQGEGWENYDTTPRYRFDRKNSVDEMSIMLKNEVTF
jgi:hypothetical protein